MPLFYARNESCLDGPDGCSGKVTLRTTPDRMDNLSFPRCEAHFALRVKQAERNLELLSPTPAKWFDPSFAGERWDDDD